MRYHVPRDGFVWHSDVSARKRRWPVVVGVLALAGVCFGAGLLAAGALTPSRAPSLSSDSAVVAETPAPTPVRYSAPPTAAQPSMEKSASLGDATKAPVAPAPSAKAQTVNIINPDADDDDAPDAVETPKPRARPVAQTEPKKTARSRATRAEMPNAPPPAPKTRSGVWGETGPAGYSALRESVFDR